MSSRGTSRGLTCTAYGNIGDIYKSYSSTLGCDVAISRKRRCSKGAFQQIATSAEVHDFLAMTSWIMIVVYISGYTIYRILHYDALDRFPVEPRLCPNENLGRRAHKNESGLQQLCSDWREVSDRFSWDIAEAV